MLAVEEQGYCRSHIYYQQDKPAKDCFFLHVKDSTSVIIPRSPEIALPREMYL